jgi:hypothetical protein
MCSGLGLPRSAGSSRCRPTASPLSAPFLRLDVAADGKTAHAELWDHNTRKQAGITEDLTIESSDGNRIRGRLKTDLKELAKIDLYFDLATASMCYTDGDKCRKN